MSVDEPRQNEDVPGRHVPHLRPDFAREDADAEIVVWSPIRPAPVVLDPVTSVFLDIVDGVATVDELATDLQEVVGVSEEIARRQIVRQLGLLDAAGLLSSSAGSGSFEQRREPFLTPPNT